jgi:hypothetical protein
MLITQRAFSHVGQFNGALGTGIHEPIAALWVELSRSDDFCQLFHVGRLDVDDIETLILNVEVPQIDPEIIATNESLAVAVDRYAVDMVGVCIGVCATGDSRNDGIVVRHAW